MNLIFMRIGLGDIGVIIMANLGVVLVIVLIWVLWDTNLPNVSEKEVLEVVKTLPKRFQLHEVAMGFEELKGKVIDFVVPREVIGNVISLSDKTIGFSKGYGYNYTTLEFSDECLFCRLKDYNLGGQVFTVEPKEISFEENGNVKSLIMKVIEFKGAAG